MAEDARAHPTDQQWEALRELEEVEASAGGGLNIGIVEELCDRGWAKIVEGSYRLTLSGRLLLLTADS